jgi:hypothetical protein
MSVTFYTGLNWGADQVTVSAGDGSTKPRLLSVVPTDPNRLRVTYDRPMDQNPAGSPVYDAGSYQITKTLDGAHPHILQAVWVSDTVVDLLTEDLVPAAQYTLTASTSLVMDGFGLTLDPAYSSGSFIGGDYPSLQGWGLYTFFGLETGLQWQEQPSLPPYLVTQPGSPNGNLLVNPLLWTTADPDSPSSVSNLTIGGKTAILNNAVQTAFFHGTCLANLANGRDVSILPNADYWQSDYYLSWSLQLSDGKNTVTYTGSLVKYITIPYPSGASPLGVEQVSAFAFPFRFTERCDVPKVPDHQGVQANIRNAVLVLQNGIPLSKAGTQVPLLPFEPAASVAAQVGREARDGVQRLEPRVILDPNPVVSEGEDGSVTATFVYAVDSEGYTWKTVHVPIDKVGG